MNNSAKGYTMSMCDVCNKNIRETTYRKQLKPKKLLYSYGEI